MKRRVLLKGAGLGLVALGLPARAGQKRWAMVIDERKCASRADCRACIDACPSRVLGTAPHNPRRPGVTPSDWRVVPLTPSRCTGCKACADACPQSAISVA